MPEFEFNLPGGMIPEGLMEAMEGQRIAAARAPRFGELGDKDTETILSRAEMHALGVMAVYVRHHRSGIEVPMYARMLLDAAEAALTGDREQFMAALPAADEAMLSYTGKTAAERLPATRIRDWLTLIEAIAAVAEALRVGDDMAEHDRSAVAASVDDAAAD